MKKTTKSTAELQERKAAFLGWYGNSERPKEITVEIETKEYFKTFVDIAFGKENNTENHFSVVESWEELEALTYCDSKEKNGYRIIGIYEIIPSRPIIYHKQN